MQRKRWVAVRDRGRSRRQFPAARSRWARHFGNELGRHIAWDIGIGAVSRLVADALDATLIAQNYSRLVIDCNRRPGSETSVPEISEFTAVPGNMRLSEDQKAARVRAIFRPYHDRIETELDRRRRAGRPVVLIAMHSFTPVFKGVVRPWHAGVLYNRDPRFADLLGALLKREEGLVIGDNEPYSVTDASDYTIPVHGERRGLHHCDRGPPGPDRRRQGPADVGSAARAHAAPRVSGTWEN